METNQSRRNNHNNFSTRQWWQRWGSELCGCEVIASLLICWSAGLPTLTDVDGLCPSSFHILVRWRMMSWLTHHDGTISACIEAEPSPNYNTHPYLVQLQFLQWQVTVKNHATEFSTSDTCVVLRLHCLLRRYQKDSCLDDCGGGERRKSGCDVCIIDFNWNVLNSLFDIRIDDDVAHLWLGVVIGVVDGCRVGCAVSSSTNTFSALARPLSSDVLRSLVI